MIFFSGEGVAIKVHVEKGKKHHRKVLQRHSTGEAKKYYQKRRPVTGVIHGNVSAHTSLIVTAFLKKEKITFFASPPVFSRSCPM